MSAWIAVIAVWLGMLLLVLLVSRLAGSREERVRDSDLEALASGNYSPRAGWDELDTQQVRHGAGHPLQ